MSEQEQAAEREKQQQLDDQLAQLAAELPQQQTVLHAATTQLKQAELAANTARAELDGLFGGHNDAALREQTQQLTERGRQLERLAMLLTQRQQFVDQQAQAQAQLIAQQAEQAQLNQQREALRSQFEQAQEPLAELPAVDNPHEQLQALQRSWQASQQQRDQLWGQLQTVQVRIEHEQRELAAQNNDWQNALAASQFADEAQFMAALLDDAGLQRAG